MYTGLIPRTGAEGSYPRAELSNHLSSSRLSGSGADAPYDGENEVRTRTGTGAETRSSSVPAAKNGAGNTPAAYPHQGQHETKPPTEAHTSTQVRLQPMASQMPPHVATPSAMVATKAAMMSSVPWSYSSSAAFVPPSYTPGVRPVAYTSSSAIVIVTPVPDTTPSYSVQSSSESTAISWVSDAYSYPSALTLSTSTSTSTSSTASSTTSPSTAYSTTASLTTSYPAPIFGTPIQQGPARSTDSGTAAANAANRPVSALSSSKSGLPRGATAGIVVVAVLALFGLGLFGYRKWSIAKRQKRVDWWIPQPYLMPPPVTEKTRMERKPPSNAVAKAITRVRPPSLPLPPLPAHGSLGPDSASAGFRVGSGVPLMTNTIPPVPPLPEMYRRAQSGNGGIVSPPVPAPVFSPPRGARAANIRTVRCVFEPRMGDELRIRHGEALRVLAEYDDGWGFCENARGERGMIPLECLDREDVMSVRSGGNEGVGDDESMVAEKVSLALSRRSVRKSSLPPKRT